MPAVQHLDGLAGHDLGVALHALAVEGWLDKPPLPPVHRAIGGQQRGAKPRAQSRSLANANTAGALDQEVIGMLRAEGEDDRLAEHVDGRDWAVGAMQAFDKGQRVALELWEIAE